MASWEDFDDEPDVIEPVANSSPDSTTQTTEIVAREAGASEKLTTNGKVPPKAIVPNGMNDAASISQAYNAAQPKVRILQRQPQASATQRATNTNANPADADESAARLHANFEQKQRDYEAARKKLFAEESTSTDGAAAGTVP